MAIEDIPFIFLFGTIAASFLKTARSIVDLVQQFRG